MWIMLVLTAAHIQKLFLVSKRLTSHGRRAGVVECRWRLMRRTAGPCGPTTVAGCQTNAVTLFSCSSSYSHEVSIQTALSRQASQVQEGS